MKCWRCGKENDENAFFCRHCSFPGGMITPLKIGPYTVSGFCGQGQSGRVFKAHSTLFPGVIVAIKYLYEPISYSPEVTNELQYMDKLPKDNKNLVHIHRDSCREEYIVMDYVDGNSLHKLVREKPDEVIEHAPEIIKGICNGIKGIHTIMLHRDLKPKNILITSDWTSKVADVGLAKIISSDSLPHSKVGSLEIIAPEVINLIEGDHYTETIDLWALGVIIYFIYTAHYPFGTDDRLDEDYEDPGKILGLITSFNYKQPEEYANIPPRITEILNLLLAENKNRISSIDKVIGLVSEAPSVKNIDPEKYNLNQYQYQVSFLYGVNNAKKYPADFSVHTQSQLSFIDHAVFEKNPNKKLEIFKKYLPRLFAWLCAIVDATGLKLDEVIYSKYPGTCPYCGEKICTQEHKIENEKINLQICQDILNNNIKTPPENLTFKDFKKMFKDMYGDSNKDRTLFEIVMRISSELAEFYEELLQAIKGREKEKYIKMCLEIADVFAWVFAFCNALPEESFCFENIFWKAFSVCPWCKEIPCNEVETPKEIELTNWHLSKRIIEKDEINKDNISYWGNNE